MRQGIQAGTQEGGRDFRIARIAVTGPHEIGGVYVSRCEMRMRSAPATFIRTSWSMVLRGAGGKKSDASVDQDIGRHDSPPGLVARNRVSLTRRIREAAK